MNQTLDHYILSEWEQHISHTHELISTCGSEIATLATQLIDTLEAGKKIMLCGNGGSAADAQHIAAELSGRYLLERKGLAAIALTTDTSALTAIGNDYGFDRIFSRQVEAIAQPGDFLIGISTSGTSANVLAALTQARAVGCQTAGFTGASSHNMISVCDVMIAVPSTITARIQEMHILVGHMLCGWVEKHFADAQAD